MPPRISTTPSPSVITCRIPRSALSNLPAPACQLPKHLHKSSCRAFSACPTSLYPRKATREKTARGNLLRGMSAIKGTGIAPWIKLSVTEDDIKQPRNIEQNIATDETHGLWQFFNGKQLLTEPWDEAKHGRHWELEELRPKSFEDLHSLWWTCLKERNRLQTEMWNRRALKAGFGESEALKRRTEVLHTMKHIKTVLSERFYAWEDARKIAELDPHIISGGDSIRYLEPEDIDENSTKSESLESGIVNGTSHDTSIGRLL